MYNDLYGLFTIRWSGGTGKRNCWVVSMSFLDGGSHGAIQQIEQLIPSNSLVSYVFYILGAGFPFKTATRIKKSWPSESPLRSFGFFPRQVLMRVAPCSASWKKSWSPRRPLEENPKWGHPQGPRPEKRKEKHGNRMGKWGENIGKWGNIWFPHDQFKSI